MLPSHESKSRQTSNGLHASSTTHSMNWIGLASLCWLLVSIGAIYYGFRLNYLSHYSYDLRCDRYQCSFIKNDEHDKAVIFERSMIRNVDLVKLKDGKVVEVVPSNDNKRGIPREFSVLVTLSATLHDHHQSDFLEPFLIRPPTHSKTRCNMEKQKIDAYRNSKAENLNLKFASSMTVSGLLFILFGLSSALLSIVMGQWTDPSPKRLKKLS